MSKRSYVKCQDSFDSVSKKMEDDNNSSVSSDDEYLNKSCKSDIPNLENKMSFPVTEKGLKMKHITSHTNKKLDNQTGVRRVVRPQDPSVAGDSKESKMDNLTFHQSTLTNNLSAMAPVSKRSIMTFYMSKDGTPPRNKEVDEITNGLSFNGNQQFIVQSDSMDPTSDKAILFGLDCDDAENATPETPNLNINMDEILKQIRTNTNFKKASSIETPTKVKNRHLVREQTKSLREDLPSPSSFMNSMPKISID